MLAAAFKGILCPYTWTFKLSSSPECHNVCHTVYGTKGAQGGEALL